MTKKKKKVEPTSDLHDAIEGGKIIYGLGKETFSLAFKGAHIIAKGLSQDEKELKALKKEVAQLEDKKAQKDKLDELRKKKQQLEQEMGIMHQV